MFARRASDSVIQSQQWSPVVLVEGPRQAGKSVLVRDLVGAIRPAAYVTLDDATTLASAREKPQDFILGLPDPVVIDEVQRAPEVFLPIKLSVDQDRRPGRFTLAGSANVLLLPRLADSLAGRMRIVMLWPLSQGEIDGLREGFLTTMFEGRPLPHYTGTESRRGLVERIVRGGFPEAVTLPKGAPREGWMSAYTTAIIERDLTELAAIGDNVALPRLLRLLAARSATVLNVADLARLSGIARTTLDRYVALLTRVYAVQLVPAWTGDVGRRLIKSPKVLLLDSGLAAHLVGVDAQRLLDDPDRLGPLLETFVGTELLKQIAFADGDIGLMHFRDGSGNEVDWVLEDRQGRLVGVEVKSTASPTPRDAKGLRSFAAAVGDRFHRGILLHTGTGSANLGDSIWALPVDALWRLPQ